MLIRIAILIAALFLFLAPLDVVVSLFVANQLQADLLRLVAAVTVGWAAAEIWAFWRGEQVSRQWQLAGLAGVVLLAMSLVMQNPTLTFFSFPLMVGSTLSALMALAESWRETVIARRSSGSG